MPLDLELALRLIHEGQVWRGFFPYSEDESKGKVRPILIMKISGDKLTVSGVKITSSAPFSPYDFYLADWKLCGLKHESVVCPSSVRVIDKSQLVEPLGYTSERDWEKALAELYAYLEDQEKK